MLKQGLPYIIALVVLIVLFSSFGYPLFKKTNEANKLLAENVGKLKQIYSSENLPSRELIASLQKDCEQLNITYEQIRTKLPISEEQKLPEGVNLPLFYLEEFKNAKERVRTTASKKSINISTENFGLPDTLPTLAEAPQLIRNLYIIEMIADLLLNTGVDSINSIILGTIQNTDIYEEFSINLGVMCDISSLTNLLFTLENTDKGFFIIRDFSVISSTSSAGRKRLPESSIDRRSMSARVQTPKVMPEENIDVNLAISIIRWK